MYLNHQLVPGFPITLRYGEERDRDFLADIFTEVWGGIPELDRTAILARGYGCVTVDVVEMAAVHRTTEMGGEIRLARTAADTYPRNVAVHLVARELAHKVDEFVHPKPLVQRREPLQNARQRVAAILDRWGYPAKAGPQTTAADEARIRANRAERKPARPRAIARSNRHEPGEARLRGLNRLR